MEQEGVVKQGQDNPVKQEQEIPSRKTPFHYRRGKPIKPDGERRLQEKPSGDKPRERPPQYAGPRPIDISVIVPLLDEEESLVELSNELRKVLSAMNVRYEVIFVDDGSTDKSLQVLRQIHRNNYRMKVISFRRNYGKSAALSVGFQHALGNIVITMDADLQDDPSEIPNLVKQIRQATTLSQGGRGNATTRSQKRFHRGSPISLRGCSRQ